MIKELINKMVNILEMETEERKCVLRLCRPDTAAFVRLVEVDEKKNHAPVILEEYEKQCSKCRRPFGLTYYEPQQQIV